MSCTIRGQDTYFTTIRGPIRGQDTYFTKKYKDANNLTAYYWYSRNLMTKVTVTVSGTPTDHTFAYDALGRRKSMTTGGTTTEYMYEGLKVLVEKTGALTKRYTNGLQAVDGIISSDDGVDTT